MFKSAAPLQLDTQVHLTWPESSALDLRCAWLQLEFASFLYLARLDRASALVRPLNVCPKSRNHTSDPLLRVVLCPTPRLASTFRAESISSLPRRTCSAAPRGMNDSVCTQCLGVAFGEAQKTLLLGCFLTPDPPLVIMQRAAAAVRACGSQLCFAV